MRLLALTAAALLASASAAFAAPASVNVTVGPELQKKFEKTLGVREADVLTSDLRTAVERALAKKAAHDGARIELILTDVKPNRPTFKQLGDTPGLSFESFGVGGAAIEGRIVAADGTVSPVDYKWFETDIRQARASWVWSDAEWTFDRFARRLARGQEVAGR
ncbi:MAG: hypothetical protein KKE02_04745 [Alphaproteobacteria bacterium]|nr:hypothetical protein [Alphaproteobacteria bacterium]MBU1513728.1 hypothetical protein [Alphaproteobacteria bacterium]MBU2094627.1 hypothetical protein [Alphaproteobacteria bacterium]MBU2150304.1 hypothetical protein [Alphaproteobacteria bacterium]MBU2309167.1 hypothetical protein [Alphaproteobacteria bacterium]